MGVVALTAETTRSPFWGTTAALAVAAWWYVFLYAVPASYAEWAASVRRVEGDE